MNISNLQEFLAIVNYGSFENAADQLFTTQSTLSKHIQKMEAELKVPLFDRSSRKVVLSEYGRLLLPYAQKIVRLESEYLSILHSGQNKSQFTINMGAVSNFVAYRISEVLVDFKKLYPNIRINIFGETPIKVHQKLLDRIYDLAFLRYSETEDFNKLKELEIIPFTEDRIVVGCSKNHPLASRDSVSLNELASERMLGYQEHTFMNRFMTSACTDAGFIPQITMVANHTENIIAFSAQNIGICLLMKKQILHTYHPNIAIVDVNPPYKCRVDLCYLKARKLAAPEQKFIEFVRRWVMDNS